MPSVTVSVDIKAPLGAVWEAAADLASHGQWMADVESIDFDSDDPPGGRNGHAGRDQGRPFRTTDVMTVTAWEPRRRISVEHQGLFTGRGEFDCLPLVAPRGSPGARRSNFPGASAGPSPQRSPAILVLIWRGNLRRLKALLEG